MEVCLFYFDLLPIKIDMIDMNLRFQNSIYLPLSEIVHRSLDVTI